MGNAGSKWRTITINISGEGDIYQGYFRADVSNVIEEFYDYGTNPRSNVLLSNGFHDSDNNWSPGDSNFTTGGVDLSSIPYLDASLGGREYNIYYEGGSNFIYYSNSEGYGTIGTDPSGDPSDANKVTLTFTDLSDGIWIRLDTLWGGVTRNDFYFRVDSNAQIQEFYSYDAPDVNILSDSEWWEPDNGFSPEGGHVSGNFIYPNITSIPALDQTVGAILYQIYPENNTDDGIFGVGWTFTGTDGSPADGNYTLFQGAFSTLLGRPVIQPEPTFKARRPQSSSELLALQRIKIEKTLNIPPSINLQDSSELTARIRKGASVMKTVSLPGKPTKGNSGNMVKFNDSSVVQAMLEGNVYRAAACNYQPRQQTLSWLRPNRILDDQVTYPKAIASSYQISNAAPRVVGFDPVVRFGWRRNDNKAVFQTPPPVPAIPVDADWNYNGISDRTVTCEGAIGMLSVGVDFYLPEGVTVTSIEVVGYESTWDGGGGYGIYIPGIAVPQYGDPDVDFPITVLLNGGVYIASGTITIDDHAGLPLSTAQLYDSNILPTETGGSLYFPAGYPVGYMCAGFDTDFCVAPNDDFTIMWWQYATNNTQYPRIFSMGTSYEDQYAASIEQSGNRLLFWRGNGNYTTLFFSSSVNDGDWHHVALIRSSGTVRLYRDGVSNDQTSYTGIFGSLDASSALFILGARRDTDSLGEGLNGNITQFVFDNGWARYVEDFNVPTATPPVDPTTVLLLTVSDQANAGKDDSGRNHDFQFYGTGESNTPGFAPPGIAP